jgi:hypothetical protein
VASTYSGSDLVVSGLASFGDHRRDLEVCSSDIGVGSHQRDGLDESNDYDEDGDEHDGHHANPLWMGPQHGLSQADDH